MQVKPFIFPICVNLRITHKSVHVDGIKNQKRLSCPFWGTHSDENHCIARLTCNIGVLCLPAQCPACLWVCERRQALQAGLLWQLISATDFSFFSRVS